MARVARQPLIVDFWDVGQGDATVVRPTPNRAFIIDVGPRNSPIVDWIIRNPSIGIEGIVVTHNDADHAGALSALIDAASSRIECVYFLKDRSKKDAPFARLFSRLNDAFKAGELKNVKRLEAPGVLWQDPSKTVEITVQYPSVLENIAADDANETSGILMLGVKGVVKVLWAGDAPIEMVAKHCSGSRPDYMVGPHHGAPSDRAHPAAKGWLQDIGAQTNLISVGSRNGYQHPQVSFLRKTLHAGSRVVCTQLTPLCDKARKGDVIKSHARYGLPQPNTGIACRGVSRVMLLSSNDMIGDDLDVEHQEAIHRLQRPKCLRLGPAN